MSFGLTGLPVRENDEMVRSRRTTATSLLAGAGRRRVLYLVRIAASAIR